jgi:hypothetical protein
MLQIELFLFFFSFSCFFFFLSTADAGQGGPARGAEDAGVGRRRHRASQELRACTPLAVSFSFFFVRFPCDGWTPTVVSPFRFFFFFANTPLQLFFVCLFFLIWAFPNAVFLFKMARFVDKQSGVFRCVYAMYGGVVWAYQVDGEI